VCRQVRQDGSHIEIGSPKSDASNRMLALDHATVAMLRRMRRRADPPTVSRKTVQAMLGHASIVLTADTYTSVLPSLAHEAAAREPHWTPPAAHRPE
jgi:integrase